MSTRTTLANREAAGGSGLLPPLVAGLGSLVKAGVRDQPFQRDAAFIEQVFPLLRAVNLYFDTSYRGWRHVPRDTPCLIVGNHSGGAESNDFAFLLYKSVQERGATAPLYSLTYDLLFGVPGRAAPRNGRSPWTAMNRLARANPHPVVERLRELPREIFARSGNGGAATGAEHAHGR